MKKIISAIIIDNDDTHKFDDIEFNVNIKDSETKFNLSIYNDSINANEILNINRGFDCLVTIGKEINVEQFNNLPFLYRKKWVHFDEFDASKISIAIISTFLYNINREDINNPLFSFFTSTYNTPKGHLKRLYKSLVKQTYNNWNWWIIDDSDNGKTIEFIKEFNDPRITVISNVTNHGNIGFNKHTIASICDGDFLVEIDHDDEVTEDCLEYILKASRQFPDSVFFYSHAMEEMDGKPVNYGDYFALGMGKYRPFKVNGKPINNIATTPDINCLSLRHIVGLPNHVRCWKREFYHKIGGHNIELSILDDMDILIRTFLNGKMCKINKVLYIQHEGSSNDGNGRGSTTQGQRLSEIFRVGALLKQKYDKDIHNYLTQNNIEDTCWVESENGGYSDISIQKKNNTKLNYTYYGE